MKMRNSFFNRDRCLVTSLTSYEESIDGVAKRVVASVANGADAIGVEMLAIPLEERTIENYRKLMALAPELPFMFILYRNDKYLGADDDARQKYLLDAASAGAEVIDVMGDLFDPEPYELAVKPEAIEKQKKLIEEIHSRGAKVIMSSHMAVPRKAEDVLAHLREQASRGADILKIVTRVETDEEFLEAVRTMLLLRRELKQPYVFLSNGAYGRLLRYMGTKLGLVLTFAAQEEKPELQPTVPQFLTVMNTIHWPVQ